jgi:SAM-dependent methyltransferase
LVDAAEIAVQKGETSDVIGYRFPPLSPSASLRWPIIKRRLRAIAPSSIIEAGSGMGAMACRLASAYEYRGYEPDPASFGVAEIRLHELGRGRVINDAVPASPDRQFDLLVAFEVLEHLHDDHDVLASWSNWVKPGGHIMVSVPADPDRFDDCDRLVGHVRRYTRDSLRDLIESTGHGVVSIDTWGMPAGYLLEWVRNARARHAVGDVGVGTPGSGRLNQPKGSLGTLMGIAIRPFGILQAPFRGTDLGVGFVAVASVSE